MPGPEPVVDGESADEQKASGHEYVADEKDPGDDVKGERKKREGKEIQPRDPALVRGNGRHNIRPRAAQEFRERNDLQSLFARSGDDSGQSQYGLFTITAAIVQTG